MIVKLWWEASKVYSSISSYEGKICYVKNWGEGGVDLLNGGIFFGSLRYLLTIYMYDILGFREAKIQTLK